MSKTTENLPDLSYQLSPPKHGHPVLVREYANDIYSEIEFFGGAGPWIQRYLKREYEWDKSGQKVACEPSYLGTRQYTSFVDAIKDVNY